MAMNEFKQKLHSILASFENKASNDFKPELTGYVPQTSTKKSGVTIATGFDLGQHNQQQIKNLKLPAALEAKLLPFALSKDSKKAATLKVTSEEAKLIDDAVINSKLNSFDNDFIKAFGRDPAQSLDDNTRLALSSAYFNMGGKIFDQKKNPSLFKVIDNNDIVGIHKQIADFHQGGSGQPLSRRLTEAAVASGFIDSNDPKSLSNFKDLMAKNSKARDTYRQNWENIQIKTDNVVSPSKLTPQQMEQTGKSTGQFDSMKDLLRSIGEKVTSVIPSAQAAEVVPQQPEPQYATMEDLLMDRGLMKNPLLLDPKDAETMWRQF